MSEPSHAMLASAAELIDRTITRLRTAGISDRHIRILLGSAADHLKPAPGVELKRGDPV